MYVIILRGLPGAGKDHYVQTRFNKGRYHLCSADTYRMVDGEYQYDPKKDREIHDLCFRDYCAHLLHPANMGGADYLIVSNTNIGAWEFAPYYRLAEAHLVINKAGSVDSVKLVTIQATPEVCLKHGLHHVPATRVYDMWWRLGQEKVPAHYNHEVILGH